MIPQEFRKSMDLHQGEKFMVIEHKGALIFKRLQAPTIEEFDMVLSKSHARAKKLKLTEKDMENAIKKARAKK